jgi:hypothetical protein
MAFTSISCQNIMLTVFGFRKPKIESKKSIERYLSKLNQPINDVYALDTVRYNELMNKPFKPGWPADFRPIQIRVYDRMGSPVMQWASCEGDLEYLKTFDTVPPRNKGGLDSTLNLQQDLAQYFTLDGRPAQIHSTGEHDYNVIVFFAKYFPKYSRLSFNAIDQYIEAHPDLKFKVYKINVDVLDWWNAELKSDVSIKNY